MTEQTEYDNFRRTVMDHYGAQGRHDLPWRVPEPDGSFDAYKILVSELMLQQTQVQRVIPKYHEFLIAFPTLQALAAADLGDVLRLWSGLGYNRRAKYLWQAARMVQQEFGGAFPRELSELITLPGVGVNTAGAIIAYAFDVPVVFTETNIRTVFIHHFFQDQIDVPDSAILELVRLTLPSQGKEQEWFSRGENPDLLRKRRQEKPLGLSRTWYWALMDYGAFLKKTVGNLNRRSSHYAKQTPFEGSLRQVRGEVIRQLTQRDYDTRELHERINDDRLAVVLLDLQHEGLIRHQGGHYSLT